MPDIVADIIDAYIFRRSGVRSQFLLLLRGPDMAMPGTWQAVHARIRSGESAVDTALREIESTTGLTPLHLFTADFVAQFYDHRTDSILLSPAFAAEVGSRSNPRLAEGFVDFAWCDLEETTSRLPLTSQRWAVRHVFDVIALGGEEAEMYRI